MPPSPREPSLPPSPERPGRRPAVPPLHPGRRLVPGPVLALALMVLAGVALVACSRPQPATVPTSPPPPGPAEPAPTPPAAVNPLTGLPLDDPALLEQRPILASIDNHPDARPQAGLAAADLVYEVPAEGGITRLLALFVTQRPERVGPVRSSRHYFLDLAAEWDALYVHAGGSPQHYARIGASGLDDLDGVRSDPRGGGRRVFTRDNRRAMPHNLYASLPVAVAAAEERGWAVTAQPPAAPFTFLDPGARPAGQEVEELVVHWPGWRQGWVRYRWTGQGFRRETAFGPHAAEETGQPLAPASLLIQFVPSRPIAGDAAGRLDVDVTGSGRLLIATGGRWREGRWEKPSAAAPTRWLEAGGQPVTLVPGPVWVHLVPTSTRVEIQGPDQGPDAAGETDNRQAPAGN
ncbi:DUF3048 domain-containing protein [Thermaerobacter subterraneus]|uniref:DUF3048 domain-containing protein n=1 Tax=Thermaerobacter subterraneus DSM 13965 TaxID=867903 RepID=K6P1M9_9FIRM|nr:DUF3048 domain-containing protein [Thermaerobacter subterraneus]EKP94975.1 Protein of unknown function (DUF3048) [Thermaerobacter subterraneus DSM 13965]